MLKISPVLLLVLALGTPLAYAEESRYVIDTLIINLRKGPSNDSELIRTLPSGTKLTLLDSAKDTSRVRTEDGAVGWVLNQYISPTPAAKDRLAVAERELTKLRDEVGTLRTERDQLRQRSGDLGSKEQSLSKENAQLTEELATLRRVAAKPMETETENIKLREQSVRVENEVEMLRQETQALRDRSQGDWFLRGAGVVVLGIIIGLIAPRLRPRKKSGWDSL